MQRFICLIILSVFSLQAYAEAALPEPTPQEQCAYHGFDYARASQFIDTFVQAVRADNKAAVADMMIYH